jgi:hypothetical protein
MRWSVTDSGFGTFVLSDESRQAVDDLSAVAVALSPQVSKLEQQTVCYDKLSGFVSRVLYTLL